MPTVKVPPQDEQAEIAVLGSILIDRDSIVNVVDFLRPEQFYVPAHGIIFGAMMTLFERHEPVDLVTLTTELKKTKSYTQIGGAKYLSSLLDGIPTAANIEHYGRAVQDCFTKRQLISAGIKITERAFNAAEEVKKLLDESEAEIFAISQFHIRRDFILLKDALSESFDRLDELHKRGSHLRGLSTGFTDLDNKLSGLQPSNLLILAARPGQGKTAFVLNMAQHIAVTQKIPVGIFSLEMSKEELVDRLLVSQADVDAWRLKTGRLSDEDFTRLSQGMGELAEAPLFIDDTPGLNILEMRTKARRLQVEHQVGLIIVDYLQLVDPGRRYDSRVQEVSIISQSLKNLARELRIPVLAVSQLSRAVEARGTRVPQLADLRESGSIEQDADVVMFIYREQEEAEKWSQAQIMIKLLIAKHRNGPVGGIDMLFRGDRIRFYDLEKKRDEVVDSFDALIPAAA